MRSLRILQLLDLIHGVTIKTPLVLLLLIPWHIRQRNRVYLQLSSLLGFEKGIVKHTLLFADVEVALNALMILFTKAVLILEQVDKRHKLWLNGHAFDAHSL